MNFANPFKFKIAHQYLICITLIVITAVLSYFSVDFIDYRVVALILLLAVSMMAILFDIFPVLVAAVLSALIWNFFFIPPILNFHIGTPEDMLLFLMYFVIALINAVFTHKIKQFEKRVRKEEEREKTIVLYNTLLNSLSHELRTPISTIIGAIDTIKDGESKLSETNRDTLYSEIGIAGFRLNRHVENLLNMSRLEAGILKPKPDWCDVNELIHGIIQDNKEASVDHQVIFDQDEQLPLFKIDRGLVEQILSNILYNALQHTPGGTEINIKVRSRKDFCLFIVSDNGKGFPEDEKNRVFDKFYRISKHASSGTGLGLSIVKGFTEVLGGTIELQNNKTGGASFLIEIPANTLPINGLNHEHSGNTHH